MEFAVQCMDSPKHTLALAEWAEQRNLACFAPADHYVSAAGDAWDQITLLGAVAARTRSIELATLVSPITFRHPAVMLKSAVTLDGISGGRFSLGRRHWLDGTGARGFRDRHASGFREV